MARKPATLGLSSNIELRAAAPLDGRQKVETLADLTAPESFPYHFVGMETYCVEAQKWYTLRYDDPTNIDNWVENGSGRDGKDGSPIIVDSVTKQGRENIITLVWTDIHGADHSIDVVILDGAVGAVGPTGPEGPAGADGQSFSITGIFDSYEDLIEVHPTGNEGDAYFVQSETDGNPPDVYVWLSENNEWTNIGALQGGRGIQGPVGPAGFSPDITVAETSDGSYKLRITTASGSYLTPNLQGNLAPQDKIDTSANPVQSGTIKTALETKQNSELSSSMSIGGVTADTVEEALTALNEKAVDVDTTLDGTSDNPVANSAVVSGLADKQGVDLSSPVTIDGVQVDTVEGAISALNTKTVDVDTTLNPSSNNPIANSAVVTGLETKQDKNLSSTIFIDGTAATTVEAGLSTLNTKKVNISDVGSAKGVAELDANGKVPASQLPSFVDDVIDDYFYDPVTEKFYEHKDTTDPDHPVYTDEITPESGKIYIDPDSSAAFRWTGHIYVSVGSANALVLGETSSTAYRGDRGKIAYDTSQENSANIGEMNSLTTTEKGSLVGAINEVNANKVTAISGKGLSTNDYTDADKTAVDSISNKVDKVSGKGLSTNDYTDADKDKVDYIDALQPQIVSTSIIIPDDDPDSDAYVTGESVENSLLLLGNTSTMLRDKKIYAKNIAEEFDSTKNYAIDDYVTYKGRLYKTIVAHTAGNWDSSHFEEKQVMDEITAAMISDYETLQNKPQIAGITLTGNKTYSELGIQQTETGKGLSSNDYTNADKAIVDGVSSSLDGKVDKVTGKTLSTNDYTDNEKGVVEASATHMSATVTDTNGVHGLKVTPVTEDEDAIYYKNGNSWKQIQLGAVTQLEEMPTAAAKYSGKIYQFVGTTTQDYKKGYFYECVNSAGVYAWQAVRVQSGGGQTIQYDPLPTAEASIVGQLSQYIGATNANYTRGYFYECVAIETEDEQTGETTVTFGWDHVQVQDGEYLSDEDLEEIKSEFHPQGSSVAPQPMRGATTVQDGRAGYVPTPYIKDRNRFLAGDGRWHEIYTGGSGSTVLVKVEDSTYYGKQVTMTDGVDTLTSTFDNSGEAVFTNVTLFGSVVLESVNDEDYSALGSTNLTYFGMYVVGISADYSIINISTTDTDLYGQDVDVYLNGSEITGTTIGVNGNATVIASELGTYELRAKSGQRFAKATVRVNELKHIYSAVLKLTTIFAVHYSESDSDGNSCDYPQGYSNSDWDDYFYVDLTTGTPHYGDWSNDLAKFLFPKSCMLKYDGTVDYYLDENDESKKIDGTVSDYNNFSYGGNAMMEWGQDGKRIYWTIIPDSAGDGWTFVVGDGDYDGLLHPWNHYDANNNLIWHFYTPKYHGTVNNGKLRSIAGSQASSGNTRQTDVTYARANGNGYDTEVYADWFLISMLLVLMSKSLKTQVKYGRGYCDYTWNNRNDSKVAGGMYDKGQFYGTSEGGTSGLGVKVFGMEHPWGNMWRGIRGLMNVGNNWKVKLTRGNIDGTSVSDYNFDGSGYEQVGSVSGTSGGYISKMNITSKGLVPKVVSGSETTYYEDGGWFASGTMYTLVGGTWAYGSRDGGFGVDGTSAPSNAYAGIGAALSCKPLSEEP